MFLLMRTQDSFYIPRLFAFSFGAAMPQIHDVVADGHRAYAAFFPLTSPWMIRTASSSNKKLSQSFERSPSLILWNCATQSENKLASGDTNSFELSGMCDTTQENSSSAASSSGIQTLPATEKSFNIRRCRSDWKLDAWIVRIRDAISSRQYTRTRILSSNWRKSSRRNTLKIDLRGDASD